MKLILFVLLALVSAQSLQAQTQSLLSVYRFSNRDSPGPVETQKCLDGQEPSDVGKSASIVLGIQVWATVLPDSFSKGPLLAYCRTAPKSHAEAEGLALKDLHDKQFPTDSPLILWGEAFKYGDGVVVKTYLTVFREGAGKIGSQIWKISVRSGQERHTVAVDIPAWTYEFTPIVLGQDLPLETDEPTKYPVYKNPDGKKKLGVLGWAFTVEGRTGDYIVVSLPVKGTNQSQKGYVYAPVKSQKTNEVISFCSAVIRVFNQDWSGAVKLFENVVKYTDSPTTIRINAYLYMAIAREKKGDQKQSLALIESAYRLNPYDKVTVQYLCMSYLSRLARLSEKDAKGDQGRPIIKSIQDLVSKNDVLFSPEDPWLNQVREILASLGR